MMEIMNTDTSVSGTTEFHTVRAVAPSAYVSKFEDLLSEDSDDELVSESVSNAVKQTEPSSSEGQKSRNRSGISEDKDEIILSLVWLNNRVGAAYYNILTSELYVMNDMSDDVEHFNVTKAVYKQAQPRYVITTAGSFENFLNAIKKLVMSETLNEDWASTSSAEGRIQVVLKILPKKDHNYKICYHSGERIQVVLKILPKKDHNYKICYHRVRCLMLQPEPKNASSADRLMYLNALLNFKSHAMIYALGLLLTYVDKHWNNIALDPIGQPSFVSLNHIMLQDLVMIDEDTYKALNITQTRNHPSFFKFGKKGATTHGISLFTLLNRCQSKPGVLFLWKTIRHPTRNIETIRQRFDVIDFFLDSQNQSVAENLTSCLKHVYRLTSTLLSRYSGPRATAGDWNRLQKTVTNVINISEICEMYTDKTDLFRRLATCVTDEMHYIKYFIECIVDFEASRHENTFVVKQNVDPILDELYNMKSTLPRLLTKMGEKDMEKYLPPTVTSCTMLYLPYIGYVLAIKEWDRTPPELLDFPGFEFKFTVNGARCYKSPSARELDNTVGDIVLKITKRQSEIMLKLVRYINKHAGPILSAIQLCAELDTLLSFYVVARDHNYVRPDVVESQIIDVKQGRHPLQELLTTFVPNDVESGNGGSLMKILTGSNACGKSVYLKQVALIVFMAHIGCYVPADEARIGIVTHILAQMLPVDSILLNASTFLQDLRQINMMLSSSTPNSLVIIDEFGKGTSEVSGLTLLAAVLSSFVERGNDCPHIFVATHIHRVINLLPETPLIEMQTFEYVVNDDKSLAFLYRLISGSVTCSFAHAVAKSSGLNESVVKRALEVFAKIKEDSLLLPLPAMNRQNTAKEIIEQVTKQDVIFDLDDLKAQVRHCIAPLDED